MALSKTQSSLTLSETTSSSTLYKASSRQSSTNFQMQPNIQLSSLDIQAIHYDYAKVDYL